MRRQSNSRLPIEAAEADGRVDAVEGTTAEVAEEAVEVEGALEAVGTTEGGGCERTSDTIIQSLSRP